MWHQDFEHSHTDVVAIAKLALLRCLNLGREQVQSLDSSAPHRKPCWSVLQRTDLSANAYPSGGTRNLRVSSFHAPNCKRHPWRYRAQGENRPIWKFVFTPLAHDALMEEHQAAKVYVSIRGQGPPRLSAGVLWSEDAEWYAGRHKEHGAQHIF